MAVLNDADYAAIRDSIYQQGLGKEEFKAAGPLPSRTQILAAFQALEDGFINAYAGLKAAMDAELGYTTTGTHAKKIIAGYLKWKINDLLGS